MRSDHPVGAGREIVMHLCREVKGLRSHIDVRAEIQTEVVAD
jgi:hypothetical protein